MNSFFFFKRFYLFIFRERGRKREREGEKHQCEILSWLSYVPWRGTKPATQACGVTRNWTRDLLLDRMIPNRATLVKAMNSFFNHTLIIPEISSEGLLYASSVLCTGNPQMKCHNPSLPGAGTGRYGHLGSACQGNFLVPVSYTHLTLPTIVEWCRSRWSPYH